MKWAFFLVGSAGLLTGAGCASQPPYAYYPPGYSPPVVATPAQYPTVAAQPQYLQPAAPVAGAAPPTTQPVIYAAPQQAYAAPQQPYAAPQQAYAAPQQACVQCCPCQ